MDEAREGLALDRFRSYLHLLARVRLGEHGKLDPSDIVQQALLEAHSKREQFRGTTEGELAAWLRQVLAGTLADAVRAQYRARRDVRRERSLDAALEDSARGVEEWLRAEQSTPSQQAERAERLRRLAEALPQLPPDQRLAVEMKYLQGCRLAEIAAGLGRSETAIGGLLRRGLRRLRELMHDSR